MADEPTPLPEAQKPLRLSDLAPPVLHVTQEELKSHKNYLRMKAHQASGGEVILLDEPPAGPQWTAGTGLWRRDTQDQLWCCITRDDVRSVQQYQKIREECRSRGIPDERVRFES